MKKQLEAELLSIAHRILQMKNKSDINKLCIETQKLHEKLTILRFVEEHFGDVKPTIGQSEVMDKMNSIFDENDIQEPKPTIVKAENSLEETKEAKIQDVAITAEVVEDLPQEVQQVLVEKARDENEEVVAKTETVANELPQINSINDEKPKEIDPKEEEVVDNQNSESPIEEISAVEEETKPDDSAIAETPKQIVEEKQDEIVLEEEIKVPAKLDFLPAFELDIDDESSKKSQESQISFIDFFGGDFKEPQFVKLEQSDFIPAEKVSLNTAQPKFESSKEVSVAEPKLVSLNDKFAKGITIGLNDRIAFVKQLFGNSDEDYNRVMNQIITYVNFEEAQIFIDEMVKPDYNNWVGKEEYSQRFMEIIEKKFA